MAYREDTDLDILKNADESDLQILVDYLTKDEDGTIRLTEELTASSAYNANPNHPKQYWKDIAAEIQTFGANTFATFFRGGKGVLYREVLCDVCDKMDVNYNSDASISLIEMNLFQKILTKAIYEMNDDDLQTLIHDLQLNVNNLSKQAVVAAIQAGINVSGFMAYQVAVIVANAVAKFFLGRGLSLAANAAVTRTLGIFAGPIGWVLTALWAAIDVAGPAYRVTIPSVIQVAYIRIKSKQ